ncbi:hypothetical protein J5690_00345, partial [bacterium]|nr:hypothetical protein [bacterium]
MDFREALRRRLGMKRRSKIFRTARKMNGVSRGDAVCAAYYLYCITELDEERKYPSDDSVDLFFKLASLLGKTDQVAEFLEKYVHSAEKRGILEPIKPDG